MKSPVKKLVILTTHFGTNFSGGSTATCEVFSRLQSSFEKIIIIGTKLGNHPFKDLEMIKYKNWRDAISKIRDQNDGNTIFYGDFYNSFLFILAKVPFYFTYHDNWPEIGRSSWEHRLQSLFYTPVYKWIFRKAEKTITVSGFKKLFIQKHTDRVEVIQNGFNKQHSSALPDSGNAILMVGNIDSRKYSLALNLFTELEKRGFTQGIDIYGHIIDYGLTLRLQQFSFVNIQGFKEKIPYRGYKTLLHTSISESFGMVFCEAIYNGVAVLAFNEGGAKEIVGPKHGILINSFNTIKMADALLELNERKFEITSEILQPYSWDNTSVKYQKVLQI